MAKLVFLDTETSSMVKWKLNSSADIQPHIVQLAEILVDEDTREEVERMSVLVRPDGWEMEQEALDVHHITMERCMDEGIPEAEALEQFISMWNRCERRVAHNQPFDARVIRTATFRFGDADLQSSWKGGANECTQKMSTKVVNAHQKARDPGHKHKTTSLAEAHQFFLGEPVDGAHDALVDAEACMRVYWAVKGEYEAISDND